MPSIQLLEPADGSTTLPLQLHKWPEDETESSSGHIDTSFPWDEFEVLEGDRSLPRPVSFAWETTAEVPNQEYELRISQSQDLSEPLIIRETTECRDDVLHLFNGTPYYWRVSSKLGDQTVAESATWQFLTDPTTPRWLRVPGITNVRDLGGWPLPGKRRIRQGLVYRSAAMNQNLKITPEGKRVLEDVIGVRTVIDLRGLGDPEDPQPALNSQKAQYLNIPINPYGHINDAEMREPYREIFNVFADPSNYPIQFHCAGGADRTGTIAFMLNGLLGASMEDLVRDYELTSMSINGKRSAAKSGGFNAMLDCLNFLGDEEVTINEKVDRYLASIGVTLRELDNIRSILI